MRLTSLYLTAVVCGFCMMALEIMGGRYLYPRFGSSIDVWAAIISVFILSLSIGYWLGGRIADKAISNLPLALVISAAAVFYLFYVFGVVWFVILPALAGGHSVWWVLAHGALLGALAYGTYEFTNMATLKGWSWTMVIVDVSWGLALTAVSAAGGFLAARALTG